MRVLFVYFVDVLGIFLNVLKQIWHKILPESMTNVWNLKYVYWILISTTLSRCVQENFYFDWFDVVQYNLYTNQITEQTW